jgi:phosphoadenosine phosphosulfate reductase
MAALPLTKRPDLDLATANQEVAGTSAESVIEWAAARFGSGLVVSTSFGATAAVMLHLVTRVVPNVPVVFLDTGYLFPETYRFAEDLARRLRLRLEVFEPKMTAARMEALYGRLWEHGDAGERRYADLTKIEPMERALRELGATAWVSGVRGSQTATRRALRRIELQRGRYKIHPILDWTSKDVHEYLKRHELPYHPLWEQGYVSIGDVHSTRPVGTDLDDRTGRFDGVRQECGLHLPQSEDENQSRGSSGL